MQPAKFDGVFTLCQRGAGNDHLAHAGSAGACHQVGLLEIESELPVHTAATFPRLAAKSEEATAEIWRRERLRGHPVESAMMAAALAMAACRSR